MGPLPARRPGDNEQLVDEYAVDAARGAGRRMVDDRPGLWGRHTAVAERSRANKAQQWKVGYRGGPQRQRPTTTTLGRRPPPKYDEEHDRTIHGREQPPKYVEEHDHTTIGQHGPSQPQVDFLEFPSQSSVGFSTPVTDGNNKL